MALARYMVRRQENGEYAIYDTETDKPAETDGKRRVNLKFYEASITRKL
jgi:hypothetical protein